MLLIIIIFLYIFYMLGIW